MINPEKVKVRRWSFCPECRGTGLESCTTCQSEGIVAELVLLSEIPRSLRRDYVEAQGEFIREQLVGVSS